MEDMRLALVEQEETQEQLDQVLEERQDQIQALADGEIRCLHTHVGVLPTITVQRKLKRQTVDVSCFQRLGN